MIGATLTIAPGAHGGHTLTVESRDIDKHGAYWLRCSCGDLYLMGEHWLETYLENGIYPLYRHADAAFSPRRPTEQERRAS